MKKFLAAVLVLAFAAMPVAVSADFSAAANSASVQTGDTGMLILIAVVIVAVIVFFVFRKKTKK